VDYEKLDVNHIDFNPGNNDLVNLEWCTAKENMRYSADRGRFKYSAEVARYKALKSLADGTHGWLHMTSEQHKAKYKTRSENYTVKGHPFKGQTGYKGKNVKMTPELFAYIKDLLSKGIKSRQIAKMVGLSQSTIYGIRANKINY
jgi:DNA-binding NarL/FixJ family response regulator